jgi:hypothetical protein
MKRAGKYSRAVTPVSGDGRHIRPVVNHAHGQTEPAVFNTRTAQSKADAWTKFTKNHENYDVSCRALSKKFSTVV